MVYFTLRGPNSQLESGKVTFATVHANVGGGYNITTGEFVCSVSGLYHFYFSFMQRSSTTVGCLILHNENILVQAATASSGAWAATSTSAHVQLQEGDVVHVGECGVNWKFVDHLGAEGTFTGAIIHL